VACLSLRWLHASCAVASVAMRPAGRAARAAYGRVLDAAHEQNRGHAGPGLMRVRSAAAKYRVWRRNVGGLFRVAGMAPAGVACLLVPAARVAGGAATRHGALCRVGLSGCCAVARAACGRSRARDLPSGLCWSACCADRVRDCPSYLAARRRVPISPGNSTPTSALPGSSIRFVTGSVSNRSARSWKFPPLPITRRRSVSARPRRAGSGMSG